MTVPMWLVLVAVVWVGVLWCSHLISKNDAHCTFPSAASALAHMLLWAGGVAATLGLVLAHAWGWL